MILDVPHLDTALLEMLGKMRTGKAMCSDGMRKASGSVVAALAVAIYTNSVQEGTQPGEDVATVVRIALNTQFEMLGDMNRHIVLAGFESVTWLLRTAGGQYTSSNPNPQSPQSPQSRERVRVI